MVASAPTGGLIENFVRRLIVGRGKLPCDQGTWNSTGTQAKPLLTFGSTACHSRKLARSSRIRWLWPSMIPTTPCGRRAY